MVKTMSFFSNDTSMHIFGTFSRSSVSVMLESHDVNGCCPTRCGARTPPPHHYPGNCDCNRSIGWAGLEFSLLARGARCREIFRSLKKAGLRNRLRHLL